MVTVLSSSPACAKEMLFKSPTGSKYALLHIHGVFSGPPVEVTQSSSLRDTQHDEERKGHGHGPMCFGFHFCFHWSIGGHVPIGESSDFDQQDTNEGFSFLVVCSKSVRG